MLPKSILDIFERLEKLGMSFMRRYSQYISNPSDYDSEKNEFIKSPGGYFWTLGERRPNDKFKRNSLNIYHKNENGDMTSYWIDMFYKVEGNYIRIYRIEFGDYEKIIGGKRVKRLVPIIPVKKNKRFINFHKRPDEPTVKRKPISDSDLMKLLRKRSRETGK